MSFPGESSTSHLLRQAGIRRIPSPQIELFLLRDFIGTDLCNALIHLIDSGRRPSTLADHNGDAGFRTSETCDLDPADPAVLEFERKLETLSGIDPAYGEPLQGQRYAVGQEFKPHTDYFTPGGSGWDTYCAVAGQRTWTFMAYLNTPDAGGATRFKAIGKTFQPEAGSLLCWNNRKPDGSVNPHTIHHGMKVRKGVKYILTKWYRERPWV